MKTYDLFDFGTDPKELVRTTDPDTSHERDLAYLRSHSITPRFAPLIRKGFIFDTGERRMASSGRSQRVVKALVTL